MGNDKVSDISEKINEENYYHNICIWEEDSECEDCELKDKLHCHTNLRYSAYFGLSFLSFLTPAVLGIIFGSPNILTMILVFGVWLIYAIGFFFFWESRILCSHCPQYSNDRQKVLHCYANAGFPKTSRFRPGPISKSEKVQFLIGVTLLVGFPIPFIFFWNQLLFVILSITGIFVWIIVLQTRICTVCVNFSCVLNRVPEESVNKFLDKNKVMKDAWIKESTNKS